MDSQGMKEHMALVQLYKDGFVKGGPDKFEIKLDESCMTEQYGANAKLFYTALTRLLDGLKKSGFSVQEKPFKSKAPKLAVGLPYAGDEYILPTATLDSIEKALVKNVTTVYICERVKI